LNCTAGQLLQAATVRNGAKWVELLRRVAMSGSRRSGSSSLTGSFLIFILQHVPQSAARDAVF
jgi:hypothetical protein